MFWERNGKETQTHTSLPTQLSSSPCHSSSVASRATRFAEKWFIEICLELVCNWFRLRYLLSWRQWSYKVVSAVGLPIPSVSDGLEPEEVERGEQKKTGRKKGFSSNRTSSWKGISVLGHSLSLSLSLDCCSTFPLPEHPSMLPGTCNSLPRVHYHPLSPAEVTDK